jgi:hypothetical protein
VAVSGRGSLKPVVNTTHKGGLMIGGIDYSSIRLASAYNFNSQQLSDTLSRIATGKKISKPSDDFAGYARCIRCRMI